MPRRLIQWRNNFYYFFYFNTSTAHLLLFCIMTNKCTIISQIVTLLHVSTLPCHPQGACNQYLPSYTSISCKLFYQQLHLKYLCNLARYWLQTPWGRHDSVETCRSVIICEIIVNLLVILQKSGVIFKMLSRILHCILLIIFCIYFFFLHSMQFIKTAN